MLAGAVRYVADNGSVNQLAYGIPWSLSWAAPVRHGLLFEALGEKTLAADPLLAGTEALGARQGVSPGLPGAVAGSMRKVSSRSISLGYSPDARALPPRCFMPLVSSDALRSIAAPRPTRVR